VKKASWIISIVIIVAISGCQKIAYKPYLPEQYRVDADEPDPTLPGILTGKRGEYVIYEK
jgi:hypothetical protein